jgi:hypothetical protein
MNRKLLDATKVAAAFAAWVALHPSGLHGADAGTGAWHHDDVEPEATESAAIAARSEREVRPLAAPFNNSAAFTNPIAPEWQPQSDVLGSPLALLAA